MHYTNNFNMPEIYSRIIKRQAQRYSSSSPSGRLALAVTTLADSPWKYKLSKIHEEEMTEDVMDLFFAFRGQMMHKALEDTSLQNVIPEINLGMEIDGAWISGRCDTVQPGLIEDFKMRTVESVWYHDQEDVDALAKQLNPYRYMLWKIFKIPVERMTGHVFLMNWVGRRAKFEHGYPAKPHFEINVPVWTYESTEEYLHSRIALFRTPIEETPICTPLERWSMPTTYAAMKTGANKASKVEDSREALDAWIQNKGLLGQVTVVERPGIDNRCTNYCRVNGFCQYYLERYPAPAAPTVDEVVQLDGERTLVPGVNDVSIEIVTVPGAPGHPPVNIPVWREVPEVHPTPAPVAEVAPASEFEVVPDLSGGYTVVPSPSAGPVQIEPVSIQQAPQKRARIQRPKVPSEPLPMVTITCGQSLVDLNAPPLAEQTVDLPLEPAPLPE